MAGTVLLANKILQQHIHINQNSYQKLIFLRQTNAQHNSSCKVERQEKLCQTMIWKSILIKVTCGFAKMCSVHPEKKVAFAMKENNKKHLGVFSLPQPFEAPICRRIVWRVLFSNFTYCVLCTFTLECLPENFWLYCSVKVVFSMLAFWYLTYSCLHISAH